MREPILVLNCGSSSIKFSVFDAQADPLPRTAAWSGKVEGIGSANASLVVELANPRARVALELYVRRIVREIGGLVAVLGGLGMLAFTAGVGEHSAELRARICRELGWLGIDIDDDANRANARTISRPANSVPVAVEPTNEEWMAAHQALATLRADARALATAVRAPS